MTREEAAFIPPSEYPKVFVRARIYAAIYLVMLAACVYYRTWLPFVFVLGPNLYGAWLMAIYGWTQHAGLAENVLDHRLNCRTITMNRIHRFLYWNMNYHLEHHMFPLVPYHQLPRLHTIVRDDCPAPYRSLTAAYREIVPTVLRQIRDPGYFVRRKLPPTARPVGTRPTAVAFTAAGPDVDGWVNACASEALTTNDVLRFDHDRHTYAIYRTADGDVRATDGMCTHGNTHLADGMVTGTVVECAKHNGRFDVTTANPAASRRASPCAPTSCGKVTAASGSTSRHRRRASLARTDSSRYGWYRIRTSRRSSRNWCSRQSRTATGRRSAPDSTFSCRFQPTADISFRDFDVCQPYASVWQANHLYDLAASNALVLRRNYSLATNPASSARELRFNVRIATPPHGQDCGAGAGSSYVYRLKPGDLVTAIGPFGDFLIRDGDREMVYVGGGAGMAPLRSHLLYLFETARTTRKVSYWYGARSRQEVFYEDEFRDLEARFPNFRFHIALSAPLPDDEWTGQTGFIHDVLRREQLLQHANPKAAEYYVCGPPVMVKATRDMLQHEFGVAPQDIAADEF